MKKTPLRKIGKRGKAIRKQEQDLRKQLKAELPVNEYGEQICPKCRQKPDWRGWCMPHIQSKGRCGETSRENNYVGCYRCHNGSDKSIGGHCLNEKDAKPCWSKL